MKKKVLSLLMAAAVVATTSVSAYAKTYDANDTETIDANVTVTGTVNTADGVAPQGKIQVEVPTALSFTVDQKGNFTVPQYTISNKSAEEIEVSVASFIETKPADGITLHKKGTTITDLDRSNVILTLSGNAGEADLADLDQNAPTVISKIAGSNTDNITLSGLAGEGTGNVDDTGVSEDFNLVFKIKKATN